jgi:hypothetical protein
MLQLLLQLDVFELIQDKDDVVNGYYKRIIEPLLVML